MTPMQDPVRGTALVVDVNDWLLETSRPYTLRATLVVEAEGVPRTTVEHSETVHVGTYTLDLDKWPAQGDTIPVTIDRADPSRVRIEWDDVPGKSDALNAFEQQQADRRKQELLAQAYGAGAGAGVSSVSGHVCLSCQQPNPEGNMFCRSCGALLPRH